ncbi:MAG: LLM class flavin-dependent oxidoreductase [Alphaproteobacteria bacterium]|jgi:alkanesulfonate monooxygenase SsuD/methylene tetrahydromethanopterin reductase-like flavin-dependent oxidoreductase (luciferase family)|nr:LLM class flavin-dependent oxidoreductase [Alphaproteobacteria bacterium]
MKWGTFSLSQIPDQSKRVAAFDADMRQYVLAEELGYDSVWIAEHLFSTYGTVTSTQVLAAAIARQTSRVAIGTAIVVIPFNHPLRTASDFALIDVLSHGRLKFGVGRAYQPHEFAGLDLPMAESRAMFAEGMEMVLKAWTEEKITHFGRYWRVPVETEVLPKPVQAPHPPVYQAAISPESFEVAAAEGWHMQLATPFTYRIYRERWMEALEEQLARYETLCQEHGRDPKAAERMMLVPFFVDETTEAAVERYAPHVEWFYNKVASHQVALKGQPETVPGYELGMREGKRTREMGLLAFEKLHEFGAVVVGDPDRCVDRLREMKERFGLTELVLWFNVGGIDAGAAEASMRLAMSEVIPKV